MRTSLIPWAARFPRPFEGFGREMEDMMKRFFGPEEGNGSLSEWFAPSTNVAETETAYEVTVDLPGIKPEEVKVEMQEGNLMVTGERSEEKETKEKTFHRVERRHGKFYRAIPLGGTVNEENITAEYKDGVLSIVLPKSEKAKAKPIKIVA